MSDARLALPAQPNLNWLKNRAKEKLRQLRAAKPSAKLAQAQLAVAREYGFPSWRKLKDQVQKIAANAAANAAKPALNADSILPHNHPLVIATTEAIRQGDLDALKRMLAENPGLARMRLGRATSANPREM